MESSSVYSNNDPCLRKEVVRLLEESDIFISAVMFSRMCLVGNLVVFVFARHTWNLPLG